MGTKVCEVIDAGQRRQSVLATAAPRETRHLFRPQRGSLRRAMAEVQEFDGTRAGLQALFPRTLVKVEKYGGGIDTRIGWDTYIVLTAWFDGTVQPEGFTNGPVPE